MESKLKVRDSNFELLRLVAIFIICLLYTSDAADE